MFGADIHQSARIYSSVQIWYPKNLRVGANSIVGPHVNCYCMARIEIGSRAVVSQGVHLCTGGHDVSDYNFDLKVAPIKIEDRAWIAAQSFVGPGVTVGKEAILGARGVTFKNLDAGAIYVGNPAKWIRRRDLSRETGSLNQFSDPTI